MVGIGLEGSRGPQTLVQVKGQFPDWPGDWRALSLSEQFLAPLSGTHKWPGLYLGQESLGLSVGLIAW